MTRRWFFQHPTLRSRLALAGRLAILLASSYFLIATSQEYQGPINHSAAVCRHPDLQLPYRVTGSCGPAGSLVLISPANECAISAQGAAELGLPAAGRFDSNPTDDVNLWNGRWSLAGYLPESSAATPAQADAGPFTVTTGTAPTGGAPVPHGSLMVRRCQASRNNGRLFLQCTDTPVECDNSKCYGSWDTCTAELLVP